MRGRIWAAVFGFNAAVYLTVTVYAVYAQLGADMATSEPIILMIGAMSSGFLTGTFGVLAWVCWRNA